ENHERNASHAVYLLLIRNCLWLRLSGIRDDRRHDRICAAMTLQQSLVRRREEREAWHEVLAIRFDAFGQTRARFACDHEADKDCIDVDLVLVQRGATA